MLKSISGEKKVKQAVRNNSVFLETHFDFHILKKLIPLYIAEIQIYFLRKELWSWLIKRAVTIRELKDITA